MSSPYNLTLVSVTPTGGMGTGGSGFGNGNPDVSADNRYVIFTSTNTNLVPGDTNGQADLFLKDLATGALRRINVAADGSQANGGVIRASISDDGHYVTFTSSASNLVANDTNGQVDVFRTNLETGVIERVNVTETGAQVGGSSFFTPKISADGRYVAFDSSVSDFVPGDTNNARDIFLKDMVTGTVRRVSTNAAGVQGDSNAGNFDITPDGHYVVFESRSANLAGGPAYFYNHIYRKDLDTGELLRVDVRSDGSTSLNDVGSPAKTLISADGRYVLFSSVNNTLVPGDAGGFDLFRKDLVTGELLRVTAPPAGFAAGDASTVNFTMSDDGRYVTFGYRGVDLITGALTQEQPMYWKDLVTGDLTKLSFSRPGVQGGGDNSSDISTHDGLHVVFVDRYPLLPSDTNGSGFDVYMAHVNPPNTAPLANPDAANADPTSTNGYAGFNPTGNVLLNDSDQQFNDPRTVTGFRFGATAAAPGDTLAGAYGSLTISSAGAWRYTVDNSNPALRPLAPGQTLTETFNYTVTDTQGASATTTLTITIRGINDRPVANADETSVAEDGTVLFNARAANNDAWNPLANDTDPDVGQAANLSIATIDPAALKGQYAIETAGSQVYVRYTPGPAFQHLAAGQTATDVLPYQVQDQYGIKAGSVITFTVVGANDAPIVAGPLTASAQEGAPVVTVQALAGSTDVDEGAVLSVTGVPAELPAGVSYEAAAKTFSLDPADTAYDNLGAGETRTVVVDFQVSDGIATTPQRVTFTVTGTNDGPVAAPLTAASTEGGAAQVVSALVGATDPDHGATLSVSGVPADLPAGVSYDAATQSFRLDPMDAAYDRLKAGAQAQVTVNYTITDGSVGAPQTLTWTITGENDAPTAAADSASANEKQTVLIDVLGNDRDPDQGDVLSLVDVGASTRGSTLAIVDGKLSYTPGAAFDLLQSGQSDSETFSYTVRDGSGATSTAEVTVRVSGVADGAVRSGTNKSDKLDGTSLDERLQGAQGEDTLDGKAGADRLEGGEGKDLLRGGDGFDQLFGDNAADVLDGGRGADTLAGGNGPDQFVFAGRDFGQDVVSDFETADTLVFSRAAFADYAALRAAAHQVGGDVLIELDAANSVLLTGIQLSSLGAGGFLFS